MLAVWLGVQDGSVLYQMGKKGCTAAIKISQIFFISFRKKKKEIRILIDFVEDNTQKKKKSFLK